MRRDIPASAAASLKVGHVNVTGAAGVPGSIAEEFAPIVILPPKRSLLVKLVRMILQPH